MTLLGIETSCNQFSVAITRDQEVLGFLQMESVGRSILLSDLIRQLLDQTKLTLPAIEGFALSIGPGSFTGLRIGVTTAKTLAWALQKPIWTVSSLHVIAQNCLGQAHPIQPLLDARKGKVYTALFSSDSAEGFVKREAPDRLCLPEDGLKLSEAPAVWVGDGTVRFSEGLIPLQAQGWQVADPAQWVPRADRLCLLAQESGVPKLVEQPHALVPQYLYSQESNITGW